MTTLALDDRERAELKRLWDKTHNHGERLSRTEAEISLMQSNFNHLSSEVSRQHGETKSTLERLVNGMRQIGEGQLEMRTRAEANSESTGHMLDRWIPLLISAVAVVLVAVQAFGE